MVEVLRSYALQVWHFQKTPSSAYSVRVRFRWRGLLVLDSIGCIPFGAGDGVGGLRRGVGLTCDAASTYVPRPTEVEVSQS